MALNLCVREGAEHIYIEPFFWVIFRISLSFEEGKAKNSLPFQDWISSDESREARSVFIWIKWRKILIRCLK
jgi:hypothetical protein